MLGKILLLGGVLLSFLGKAEPRRCLPDVRDLDYHRIAKMLYPHLDKAALARQVELLQENLYNPGDDTFDSRYFLHVPEDKKSAADRVAGDPPLLSDDAQNALTEKKQQWHQSSELQAFFNQNAITDANIYDEKNPNAVKAFNLIKEYTEAKARGETGTGQIDKLTELIGVEGATEMINRLALPMRASRPRDPNILQFVSLVEEFKEMGLDWRETRGFTADKAKFEASRAITGPHVIAQLPRNERLAFYAPRDNAKPIRIAGNDADSTHNAISNMELALLAGTMTIQEVPTKDGRTLLKFVIDNESGTFRQSELSRFQPFFEKLLQANVVPDILEFRSVQKVTDADGKTRTTVLPLAEFQLPGH